ncbi:Heparinase II/III N-terminus [Sulfitobacter pontiacus]|uniref:Heparinase II/III N-terminus n=2 Tax=Sulfitobacter pontiacus TaxID=60137 RepID=A0A1H3DQG7_9RHOB|nr:Heparinase II/III N-terminus [Sulfitobacter pontiacus]
MRRLALIAITLPRLGIRNVARVALYKLCLKLGWRPRPLRAGYPGGGVFGTPRAKSKNNEQRPTTLYLFGWHPVNFIEPPDWHADPLGEKPRLNPNQDWAKALEALGNDDVKRYWELSRFYWLPQFALAARDGDHEAGERMEIWLQDWIERNPPFSGINWACGQEAAIRLMNLALSALILESWREPSEAMKWLIETHARRIRPTLSYALGQDNNHGTAEASALFIAGMWGQEWSMLGAEQIAMIGKKWVNDRALRVIQSDGSPCQYSTTYHRANLETLCLVALWCNQTGKECLVSDAAARVAMGARWLYETADSTSYDVPNLGANDGSHLFNVTESNYRDFRPTIALASALFDDSRPWAEYTDARLAALKISPGKEIWSPATSRHCGVGGFHILRSGRALAFMHYARFSFRPGHADALHVDLWHKGINLLRDAGTFSYNAAEAEWFSGTSAHNTVEFDGRDQMPKIGRFLFGAWLKSNDVSSVQEYSDSLTAGAGYLDANGAEHHRAIKLSKEGLICTDSVSGTFNKACLRWRLAPGDWQLHDAVLSSEHCTISIEIDGMLIPPTLNTTEESRYYLHKTAIPVASVVIERATTVITKVMF